MRTRSRHALFVRITHWLTAICFLALAVTGIEILLSHPRFYWGETGNVNMAPLFTIPVPASRSLVPTGYGFVLPDQNGWSRYLHFQAAWGAVLTGLAYALLGLLTGHLLRNVLPAASSLSVKMFRFHRPEDDDASSYNPLQRLAYSVVIFVLFPAIIWTGLAMSPAFVAAFPTTVTFWGGQQSARTVHFVVTVLLLLFVAVHLAMVILAGFRRRVLPMILDREARGAS